jgi:hypothetical protein
MYCCPNCFAHSWLNAHVNEHSGRAAAFQSYPIAEDGRQCAARWSVEHIARQPSHNGVHQHHAANPDAISLWTLLAVWSGRPCSETFQPASLLQRARSRRWHQSN